tara:strand:- start:289 stop:753 length:465 start_codon:yes stop_codon:yes gene_type:complete
MSVEILSISRKPTNWVKEAINDYLDRFPKAKVPKMTYITPLAGRLSVRERLEREAKSILSKIGERDVVIVLDIGGCSLTSDDLVKRLSVFTARETKIILIIGGPEGLDISVKKRAIESWSLSGLVFPHKIIQILILEQLYRSYSICIGHPYHRG